MPNVLTNLSADLYKAADNVSRELTGFIPSVLINASGTQRVALNGTVRSHVTRAVASTSQSPSMTIPEGTNQTVDNETATISKAKEVLIPWEGEETLSVNNGSGFTTIYGDQVEQAIRVLVNEMETDLATSIYVGASRAYGTAGTTPLGTAGDYTDVSKTLQILKDNGAPQFDNTLVVNTDAGANYIGKQADANRQGSDSILRQGVLLDIAGNRLRESAQVQSHTKGTGASYQSNLVAGYAIGSTSIAVDTGTGTVIAGDSVTFAGDGNKYIVKTALAAGVLVLASPGLRQTLADNVAMTVGANYTANVMINRGSAELIVRPPAMPSSGDAAVDSMMVVDPRSGIPFEIRVYLGKGKSVMSVAANWGVKLWKSDGAAILLG